MIAVDTSAIVAILRGEEDARQIRAKLAAADGALISAANVLELQIVLAGIRKLARWAEAEDLFRVYGIAVHPFDEAQSDVAREAAVKFGRGKHKAALNFGDCFAYALAKSEGIPLLCKGDDFKLTDIALA
ncbi:MAG TPA: type II toxin-antitoxin system VapC family toxin [Rhizomicrobium sp.]|jgi:ribonuclease VapC|nr:type II toxin-antitoxin system VapC family toxin [Rhizomicrobium sp.]